MGQYLLKFLKKEEHQNDFLDGKLYMNTLKFFKKIEKLDKARLDKFEAIKKHKKQTPNKIQIGKLLLTKERGEIIEGTITKLSKKFDYCNIFCMYALWKRHPNEVLYIDEKNKEFGDYCVVIHDIKEFLRRIDKASDVRKVMNPEYMLVNYINKNHNYNKIKSEEVPYTKFDIFSYQSEFRITIDRKQNIDKEFILNIGSIRDIAYVSTIDELNRQLNR